jgi:DNA-binding YbaB/EbfC family protein
MANLMKMMKQAAAMQEDLQRVQAELAERTTEFTGGGGAVRVTVAGDGTLRKISIEPELIDPEERELLEDTVLAAVNGALAQVKETAAAEMSKLTAGLGLPGLMR